LSLIFFSFSDLGIWSGPLVTYWQGAFKEGNAGEVLMMLQKWFSVCAF
jgi:hypothetical protein